MENIKIHYGVSNISDIKEAVEKIDEATKDIDCIGLDVEISVAPKPIFENEEEE
ncbi:MULTISPECIES: hypothetical protein [Staphylococcus]|uniref:Phage protein n=1 Tax=Staphylococcus capitis TaxID=29388 RepID=A0ABX1SR89_STACP|nr:hypothetical protein [Staphylococcus capitis]MBF8132017.1 hypothetical protein [Staphylococcus capitis]MCC2081239.1 hypothetical protein [Staphylococcus capitis]MDS1000232.1 hypothetical protein [Staphylococcus capitis]NMK54162.1 hypothetical protein [Staphylococcus capitis]NMK67164.1 hypothetical protein [Staphylococcus capitis]